VLWLAFGETKGWHVFLASFVAMALGRTSILRAYSGSLPPSVLVLSIVGLAMGFTVSVMRARRVHRAFGPVTAMFAFAALWTAFDFIVSFSKAGGSVTTPAAAEVGIPVLIQTASLVGYLGITFLLGIVPAGIAASLRARKFRPLLIAGVLLATNTAYGFWRMSSPPSDTVHLALVASDDAIGNYRRDDRTATLNALDAYVAAIDKLRDTRIQLIVLPENISRVAPQWREDVWARIGALADRTHATVVVGFNTYIDDAQRNISWAFTPGAAQPVTYEKRRLVPGFESAVYTPGLGPVVLPNGVGLEICKDMDFQAMLRNDMVQTKPRLLAVPAWDFDKDDWSHARIAVLRSVENGVPMARTARDGLLTLNDRYGRLIARSKTAAGFTVLTGDLPLYKRGGDTFYDVIGDVFGWLCVVLSVGAVGWSLVRARGSPERRA
jgi:apolipoprotein N-acyltransferase